MIVLLYLFLFSIIIIKSRFFSINGVSKNEIITAFGVRVIVSVLFYLIYTEYYSVRKETDMFRYYDDALVMHEALKTNTSDYVKMLTGINDNTSEITENYYLRMNNWYESFETIIKNDNRTMIRLNALFLLVSMKQIFVHKLFFLILGFIGLLWLLKTFERDDTQRNRLLFYLILYFPSLLFWTSSITKETILLFVLGGFMYYSGKFLRHPKQVKFLLISLLFLYLLTYIKVYVILILIPILIASIVFHKSSALKKTIGYTSFIAIYLLIIWNFHHILPNYNFVASFIRKQADFIHYAQFIGAGSLIDMQVLKPEISSFVLATPMAIVNVLFRPFIWECSAIMMYPAAFENLILISLIICMFLYFRKKCVTTHLFLFSLFFCVFFFVLIGIGTPVFGAIVRYKIIGYPFLFFVILECIEMQKIRFLKNHKRIDI